MPPPFTLRLLGAPSFESANAPAIRIVGRKQLALLSFVALARQGRPVTREALLGMLWPDSDEAIARAALRQLLVSVRKRVGASAIRSVDGSYIGLDLDYVGCDVWFFQQAIARGELETALGFYRAPLLAGFYLGGRSGWDAWLDRQRDSLRREACDAAWILAKRHEERDESRAAIDMARHAAGMDPYSERGVRELIRMLAESGDRAGAMREYRRFANLMAREFDAKPSPQTRAVVATLRA